MSSGTRKKPLTTCFVVLHAHYWKENEQWLGECDELGTATFADTIEEVQAELKAMILLHLNTLEETGERDRFFKERGIKIYSEGDIPKKGYWDLAKAPEGKLTETIRVPVPA